MRRTRRHESDADTTLRGVHKRSNSRSRKQLHRYRCMAPVLHRAAQCRRRCESFARRRSMRRQFTLSFVPGLAAAAVFAWGCDRAGTPASPQVPKPSFWVGCFGGEKFTGGGRIDPAVGKTTFGLNVLARPVCDLSVSTTGSLTVLN